MTGEWNQRVANLPSATVRRILRAFVRGSDTEGWMRLGHAVGGLPFDPGADPDRAEELLDALDRVISPEDEDETDTVTLDRSAPRP